MQNKVKGKLKTSIIFNSFQDRSFCAAHGWGRGKKASLPKFCDTYSTMMNLGKVIHYLMKIQKICKWRDAHHEFCWRQLFLLEISNFAGNTDIDFILINKKFVLINMVAILMISAKLATLDLLKIKVFWNKDCEGDILPHPHRASWRVLK